MLPSQTELRELCGGPVSSAWYSLFAVACDVLSSVSCEVSREARCEAIVLLATLAYTSPGHASFVSCLMNSVPKRKKILQKMREAATCFRRIRCFDTLLSVIGTKPQMIHLGMSLADCVASVSKSDVAITRQHVPISQACLASCPSPRSSSRSFKSLLRRVLEAHQELKQFETTQAETAAFAQD